MPRKKTDPAVETATAPEILQAQQETTAEETAEVLSVEVLDKPAQSPEIHTEPQPAEEETAIPDEYPEELAKEETPDAQELSDRQKFFALDFNELDRDLTPEERKEWNTIYASYRGRSVMHGQVIGVNPMRTVLRDRKTGKTKTEEKLCAVVVLHRVLIIIPVDEMWMPGEEREDYVMQNISGAVIDFIITKVDREGGYAIASRRMASRAQRYYFAHRPRLNSEGARVKCRMLSVGPRRCTVECYGHDIPMTQRDISYTAIPNLKAVYHPGQELDCIVKSYDAKSDTLVVSIKETQSNPFDGAIDRHPVGCRRLAQISGKYGGGVFCNLPDGAVVMCNYNFQYQDGDFMVGDTVMLVIARYETEKKQIFGKILAKW